MGRAIRRLVTLYESLVDLLQAADDRATNENEDSDDEEDLLTEEVLEKRQEYVNVDIYLFYSAYLKGFRSESRFEAFKILIQVLPSVGKAIEDPATDMDIYLTQVYPGSRLVCSICPHLFICSL